MTIQEDSTIIIADDLTGANDTALQYFNTGVSAKVIIDSEYDFNLNETDNIGVWAFSTESRNLSKEEALVTIVETTKKLQDNLNTKNFYKKIDSTLRGNAGIEIIALLEILKKDVAIVAPAYIEENRTTIGGYQLLNGMPIERTQVALDPKSPITESYIPNILKKDLNSQLYELIGTINFETITKGAGPITLKIKELVQKGKKIIVTDAVSVVDLEQTALAINKSGYNVLPVGSAGLANAINKINNDRTKQTYNIEHFPSIARLVVSGSATQLTKNQIQKLTQEKDVYCIDLKTKDIIENNKEYVDIICEKLQQNIDVVVHSSCITNEEINTNQNLQDNLIDAGIPKNEFAGLITNYLSDLIQEINQKQNFILIMIGGETSHKALKKIDSKYLQIIDAILPAIPLCVDSNGKIIVTKSGNFGTLNTLTEIINYFDKLKK